MGTSFPAMHLTETGGGTVWLTQDQLPPGDVLVRVHNSSLNYKDALAFMGTPGIVRKFPMVPGIDLAGEVVSCESGAFQPGDRVVVTGCGLGETHWGGMSRFARVKSEWCVPIPAVFSFEQAMAIGTAGFTAMQCVDALEVHGLAKNSEKDSAEVLVTGAAGGVGSLAVAILSTLGYNVVASTGRLKLKKYLKELGAKEVISRRAIAASPTAPLEKSRWAGAVDVVGGKTLAGVLRTLRPGASVAACGLTGGKDFKSSVLPFILRGNNLLGINSVEVPNAERRRIWGRLAESLPVEKLNKLYNVVEFNRAPIHAAQVLDGLVQGRLVVKMLELRPATPLPASPPE